MIFQALNAGQRQGPGMQGKPLTKEEVANRMNVCRNTVQGWVDRREIAFLELPGRGQGGMIRIPEQALEEFIDEYFRPAKNYSDRATQRHKIGPKTRPESGPGLKLLPRKVAAEQAKSLY
ncbi:MAG: helix-turn-helix domain-containing protein [Chloroflexi bacterium]|nr:helix-turn-helix domain-containing protein [Chloroflexota bacterium]